MGHSKELAIPSEPFDTTAFISYVMSQVSLPYRRQQSREIVRTRGDLIVRYVATGEMLPYGKYPRLMEMYACTMIKRGDPSFDPETNTFYLGSSFRNFLKLLGINVGGRQLEVIKQQLESYFSTAIAISHNTTTSSNGLGFVVARRWRIEWLEDKMSPRRGRAARNWVQFSQEYVDYLRDKPVPVDLPTVAKLSSPMALDVYWWLTKRYYGMHKRVDVAWQQLYDQFGSDTRMTKFRETFKRAVGTVVEVYPQARITCGKDYVTLWPSEVSVPTVSQVRQVEKSAERRREIDEGHWTEIRGYGKVYTTKDLFNVTSARSHLDGTITSEMCIYCNFDDRNIEYHAKSRGSLES